MVYLSVCHLCLWRVLACLQDGTPWRPSHSELLCSDLEGRYRVVDYPILGRSLLMSIEVEQQG